MTMVILDYMCVQSFMVTYTQRFMLIVKDKVIYVIIPEACCYWLQVYYAAMKMVMLDYTCVQSFMITHTQCFMAIVEGKVTRKKFFELKSKGYRDGIKRKETR